MLLVNVSFFGKGNFVWDIMILRKWIESFGGKKMCIIIIIIVIKRKLFERSRVGRERIEN